MILPTFENVKKQFFKYLLLPTAKLCDGGGITATGLETARPLEVTDELITDPDTPNSSALEVEVSK